MNRLEAPRPPRPNLLYRMMMSFIGRFDRRLHLSCRSFIRLASEKYERPLGRLERFRQVVHRMMCRICRIQERHMDQLQALTGEIREREDGAEPLSDMAKQRIQNALEKAARDADETR